MQQSIGPILPTKNVGPFAVNYAVHPWHHSEGIESGMAPAELFSGIKHNCGLLRHARVWGCPAYVLDPKLQDGKKLPKWSTRSRRGQFLGISDNHSRHIGTIRNLTTGYVSPQFHVVYDELFGTVFARDGPFDPDVWNNLFLNHRGYVPDEDDVAPELADEWLTQDEIQCRQRLLPAPMQPPVQAIPPPRPPPIVEPDPEVMERNPEIVVPAIQVHDRDPRALNPEPEHEIVFEPMTPEHLPTRENPQWVHDEVDPDDDASTVSEPLLPPPDLGRIHDPGTVAHDDEVSADDPDEHVPHEEPTRHSTRPNRGVNRRYADYFALATVLASTTVHPTLVRGDGFLRTLDGMPLPKIRLLKP